MFYDRAKVVAEEHDENELEMQVACISEGSLSDSLVHGCNFAVWAEKWETHLPQHLG